METKKSIANIVPLFSEGDTALTPPIWALQCLLPQPLNKNPQGPIAQTMASKCDGQTANAQFSVVCNGSRISGCTLSAIQEFPLLHWLGL